MKKIIIAENKDFLGKVIETWLGQEATCLRVERGLQAVSVATSADVAVASDNLTDLPGEKILLELKQAHPGLPVVMLTSEVSSAVRVKYLTLGADDVLTKPFNPKELKLRVVRLMK